MLTPTQQATIDHWTAALRADTYEQTRCALRRCGKMCCLGVLLDITDPDGWTEPIKGSGERWAHRQARIPGESTDGTSMPDPDFFKEQTGLTHEDMEHLAGMNDNFEGTFETIADEIERRAAAQG